MGEGVENTTFEKTFRPHLRRDSGRPRGAV